MTITEAETLISGLNEIEKEILLLFLSLSPEDKQKTLDMAVAMCRKDTNLEVKNGR